MIKKSKSVRYSNFLIKDQKDNISRITNKVSDDNKIFCG